MLRLLANSGISARRGIMAAHMESAYVDLAGGAKLPVTERASTGSLIPPLFHELTEAGQDQVIGAISTASASPEARWNRFATR